MKIVNNENIYIGKNREKGKLKFTRKSLSLYLFVLPSIILLFIFHYIPIYGIIIAFENFKPYLGVFRSEFIGLANFRMFLKDSAFWSAMKNTIILNLYNLIFVFPAPILFAILANEIMNKKFKRIMQTISYLPHFLSWVVVSGMVYQILSPAENGLVNMVLVNVFKMAPIFFMTEVGLFRWIVTAVTIWKGVGWGAILYFATLSNIDTELYEAAYIDGANRIKQTIHVTLPGLSSIIVLMLLLTVASMFSIDFDRIYLLQNPLVYQVSDVISTYVYRRGLVEADYGYTTAIGLVQSLIGFVTLTLANSAAKKIGNLGLY
ncbi:MAG: sugar ABC transporter permease [Firmicutes bacterium]|nr:sugar ABC transporter permease [Bacillota bacterium]